jgi:hypothetical protein
VLKKRKKTREVKEGEVKHTERMQHDIQQVRECVFVIPFHQAYVTARFGFPLAAIRTTSIHGKSIRYDRLRELKLVGVYSGYRNSARTASSD